jgi:hypothetical protein
MDKYDYKELWSTFIKKVRQKFPDAVFRLMIVILAFIGLIILIRSFIIPPELKEVGSQRISVIERELAKETKYAGSRVCSDCHDDEYELRNEGYHGDLSCELCHGPAYAHADDPTEVALPAPRGRDYCILCHTYNLSRPTGFPQINPQVHNPLDPCITCHDPHDPKPTETPRACVACHAQIERTKAVSPHVFLECTTCHEVPEKHKTEPRIAGPTKPAKREFCARCHGLNSTVKGTAKVDFGTHGERYLCWQCHYPHMPEI